MLNKKVLLYLFVSNKIEFVQTEQRKVDLKIMQAIITEQQQTALIKKQAINRLTRTQLANKLNLARTTVKDVLDKQAPFVVSGKTFTAVNNYLLEDL